MTDKKRHGHNPRYHYKRRRIVTLETDRLSGPNLTVVIEDQTPWYARFYLWVKRAR